MSPTVMTARSRPSTGDSAPAPADSGWAGNSPIGNGMGPLGDADLARESAQLAALQNRQALGGDSPTSMNRAPLTLLSLFGQA